MMKLIILLSFAQFAFADFIPENIESYSAKSFKTDQDLQDKYADISKTVNSLYRSHLESLNVAIDFQYALENERVNAFARRESTDSPRWEIVFTGGLLRHPKLNKYVYLAIYCHELGHHLGGAPKKSIREWVSVEGQADYFATNDCIHRVIKNRPDQWKMNNPPAQIVNECEQSFKDVIDKEACKTSSMIAQDAIRFLQKMNVGRRGQREARVSLLKKDSTVISYTLEKHPKSQCRLDTMVQGSLCSPKKVHDFTFLTCLGSRPRCWYAAP